MTFPALTPSSRTWSPGAYSATAWMAINGSESRVRHSTVLIDSELRLTFLAISEADMLALLAHYLEVIGTWTTFTLPGAVWSGVATPSDYLLTGYAWRYSSPPEVVDLACGGHDVTVALRSVVPEASVGPGAELVVRVSIAHAAPVTARGATLTVQALLAGGAGVGIPQGAASGAALTVAASIVGGTASGNVAVGADLTVAASVVGGGASGNVAPGSDLTVTTAIVGGSASSPGNGAGATLTVTASITGGAASGGIDPSFNSVKLLLHMDGSNNSTTFTDSSSAARSITANGNAKVSTAESKFGGASAVFDGSGDWLSATPATDLYLPGDFTIECWAYIPSLSTSAVLLTSTQSQQNNIQIFRVNQTPGSISFYMDNNEATLQVVITSTSAVLSANTWHHLALCRSGSSTRMFVDGTQVGSTATNFTVGFRCDAIGTLFTSGTRFSALDFNGYIDEVRVTKGAGAARYTANFTPPSTPFPDS